MPLQPRQQPSGVPPLSGSQQMTACTMSSCVAYAGNATPLTQMEGVHRTLGIENMQTCMCI